MDLNFIMCFYFCCTTTNRNTLLACKDIFRVYDALQNGINRRLPVDYEAEAQRQQQAEEYSLQSCTSDSSSQTSESI